MVSVVRGSGEAAKRRGGEAARRARWRVARWVPAGGVQGNHLHFLIEAGDRSAMSNGIRALLISMARRLNRLMHQSGSRYRDRFHERALTSPSSVRNALKYVLTNASHHHRAPLVDPYSSGPWFEGWAPVVQFAKWTPCTGPPTSEPARGC